MPIAPWMSGVGDPSATVATGCLLKSLAPTGIPVKGMTTCLPTAGKRPACSAVTCRATTSLYSGTKGGSFLPRGCFCTAARCRSRRMVGSLTRSSDSVAGVGSYPCRTAADWTRNAILTHSCRGYAASSAVANFQLEPSSVTPHGKCSCPPSHAPASDINSGRFVSSLVHLSRLPPWLQL